MLVVCIWKFLILLLYNMHRMSQYIDKSWINKPRNTEAYMKGVSDFMEFAKKGTQNGFIRCPCCKCQIDRKKSYH